MSNPLKRVNPGDRVQRPRAATVNAIYDAVRQFQQQRLAPPSVRTSKKGGSGDVWKVAEVSSHSADGAKYMGKLIAPPIVGSATGNLINSDLGTTSSVEDVEIWNLTEFGASTHVIAVGTPVLGKLAAETNADGLPIIILPRMGQGNVPDPTALHQALVCTNFTAGSPPTFAYAFDKVRSTAS